MCAKQSPPPFVLFFKTNESPLTMSDAKTDCAKGFETIATILEKQSPDFGLADYARRLNALKNRRRALLFRGVSERDIKGAEAQSDL